MDAWKCKIPENRFLSELFSGISLCITASAAAPSPDVSLSCVWLSLNEPASELSQTQGLHSSVAGSLADYAAAAVSAALRNARTASASATS